MQEVIRVQPLEGLDGIITGRVDALVDATQRVGELLVGGALLCIEQHHGIRYSSSGSVEMRVLLETHQHLRHTSVQDRGDLTSSIVHHALRDASLGFEELVLRAFECFMFQLYSRLGRKHMGQPTRQ